MPAVIVALVVLLALNAIWNASMALSGQYEDPLTEGQIAWNVLLSSGLFIWLCYLPAALWFAPVVVAAVFLAFSVLVSVYRLATGGRGSVTSPEANAVIAAAQGGLAIWLLVVFL